MTRFVGYIAMSLDARIADGDGNLDWLMSFGPPEGSQADYQAFYSDVDGIVMGRGTYDWIVAHDDWPYSGKTSYVVTNRAFDSERNDVIAVSPDYLGLRTKLEREGHSVVWILGGGTVQRAALDAGMFDHIRVFVIPIIVGSGPLIFADGAPRGLTLQASRTWGQIVELSYTFKETE